MTQILLIHGAGDAGYWRYVTPLLTAAGHTVAVPQLPSTDPSADFDTYAEAALSAIDRTQPTVVVGQSLGAFTAPVVASRTPTAAIVLVAPMIPLPGETPGQWFAAHHKPSGADLMETFFHDVPQGVVDELMAEGEPQQSDAIFTAPCPIDAWPGAPTHVVAGRQDRMFSFELVSRLATERLAVQVTPIDSGHLPAFACPDVLAELLLKFAA